MNDDALESAGGDVGDLVGLFLWAVLLFALGAAAFGTSWSHSDATAVVPVNINSVAYIPASADRHDSHGPEFAFSLHVAGRDTTWFAPANPVTGSIKSPALANLEEYCFLTSCAVDVDDLWSTRRMASSVVANSAAAGVAQLHMHGPGKNPLTGYLAVALLSACIVSFAVGVGRRGLLALLAFPLYMSCALATTVGAIHATVGHVSQTRGHLGDASFAVDFVPDDAHQPTHAVPVTAIQWLSSNAGERVAVFYEQQRCFAGHCWTAPMGIDFMNGPTHAG